VTTAPTDLFLNLTPDRVLEAVEAAGLATNAVCYPLNAYENRVYEVELLDRSRVVAKFYRPQRWTAQQILEEHDFLAELAAEEIPVCTFKPFPGGGTLRSIEGIFYAVMDRRGGRAPDEVTGSLAARLGRLVARIHNVGARQPSHHRPRLDSTTYVDDNLAWLEAHGTIPAPYDRSYFEIAQEVAALHDERARGLAVQRIHGDLHLGNLLERDGLLTALDFDDMVTGPPVQDLWLALPGRDAETLALRESFLEAYRELREFDRRSLRLIEPLRGLRIVNYTAWLARRWHDPFFPQAFPHFGTESYWETEIAALVEVVAVARGEREPVGAGSSPDEEAPVEEEPTLTNRDYFWDWEDR
jgi:Ser/Thr protein kinase RdoA (MazF antagonist)